MSSELGWFDPRLGSLRRSERGLGTGLSRALSARWNIDVVLVRVAFVVLALCGGVGIVVYLWGSALTPGRDGNRPIDSLLPRFRQWRRIPQRIFIAVTSFVGIALIAGATPLPWGLGLLLLLVALLVRRFLGSPPPRPHPNPNSLSDDALVAQWRSQMGRAISSPQRELSTSHVPTAKKRSSRGSVPATPPASLAGGLGIGATAAGCFVVVSWALGLGVSGGLGSSLLLAGTLGLSFALFVRTRRLPRPLIGVLAVLLVPAGWLTLETVRQPPVAAGMMAHHVVGRSSVIELSPADLVGIETISVRAVASKVTLILPGVASQHTIHSELSMVSYPDPTGTARLPIDVDIDASGSYVEIVEAP